MRKLRALLLRVSGLFGKPRRDRELTDELESHLSMHIDDNLRAGMTPDDARRAALLKLGGAEVTKEQYRNRRSLPRLEELVQDVRYGVRVLRRSPAFTITAIVSLALGIGVNTLIFSIVNGLVLRPLPVAQPDRIVFVQRLTGGGFPTFSFPLYRDLRDLNVTFNGLVGYRMSPMEVETAAGPSRAWGYLATGNYFDVLGIEPRLGRFFHQEDDRVPGAAPLAVISFDYWSVAFAGDPSVIGRTIRINRLPYTVIGVAPEEFHGTEVFYRPRLWVPMMMQAQIEPGNPWLENRNTANTFVIGRLKPSTSVDVAEANLAGLAAQDTRYRGIRIGLRKPGLLGDMLRRPVQGFAFGVLTLVGLVLLTTCANMATAVAARGIDRQREMAIRISLGAGRMRLARLLLAETLLLALAGGGAAFVVAFAGLQALSRWQLPLQTSIQVDVHPDARVFLFALAVSTLAGVLSGLAPTPLASRLDPNAALKAVGGLTGRRRWALHDLLVGVQVTLCCVLVAACLLALRGLQQTLTMPLGFQSQGLTTVAFELALAGYTREDGAQFQKRALDAVSRLPAVENATYSNSFPLSIDRSTTTVYRPDRPEIRDMPDVAVRYTVSPGFFRALRIPFRNGRDLDWRDANTAPRVAVVNETFVREVLRTSNPIGAPGAAAALGTPIGQRFRYGPKGEAIEVVGVVADGKYSTLTEAPQPAVFESILQSYNSTTVLLIRSSLPQEAMIAEVRRAIADLDRSLPVYDTGSVEQVLGFAFLPNRVAAVTLSAFGVLAVALAASGIYGVVAYAVARRRREIGVRVALGATAANVIRLVLGRMAAIIGLGTIVGLLVALAVGQVLMNVVYLATPSDPVALGGAVIVMVLVGIVASWIPARRSLRIQPIIALRTE